MKGAPAEVMAHCDRWQDGNAVRPWDDDARARAEALLVALEADGFRVLAVAFKPAPARLEDARLQDARLQDARLQDENELVFAVFAAFLDPPGPTRPKPCTCCWRKACR